MPNRVKVQADRDATGSGGQYDLSSVEADHSVAAMWEQEAQARQRRTEAVMQAVMQEFCTNMPESMVAGEPVLETQVCCSLVH